MGRSLVKFVFFVMRHKADSVQWFLTFFTYLTL